MTATPARNVEASAGRNQGATAHALPAGDILIVSPFPLFPANDGGRVRVSQLATHLADRGNVHVTAPRDGAVPADLPFVLHQSPARALRQLAYPTSVRHLRRLVTELKPTTILVEYMWLAPHVLLAASGSGARVVVDTVDVNTVRFKRARHPLWPAVTVYERAVIRLAEELLATSDVDRDELIRIGARPERVRVVPNGVDVGAYERPLDHAERRRLRTSLGIGDGETFVWFFGQLTYAPNADAIGVLAREIAPRLPESFRIVVSGRGPTEELRRRYGSARMTFTGPVETVASYLHAADVVAAPVRHGSGTRLKVLESVAAGVPIVTTTVGCEGIDRRVCGPIIHVADSFQEFAMSVAAAARMPHQPPPGCFRELYDWRAIARRVVT